jgi:hypothetical protein
MVSSPSSGAETMSASVKPKGSASATRGSVIAGVALIMSLFAASGAQAQNCTTTTVVPGIPNLAPLGSAPASVSAMIGSTITTSNTAFLLNSTVFVGSPPNPAPDQQGGGIWARAVGGQVDMKSSTNSVATASYPAGATGTVACAQQVNEAFRGVQFGSDVAKFNINGWNFHLGTTAGVLETDGTLVQGSVAFVDPFSGLTVGGGSFTSSTEIPFFGGYVAATNGGFSIDALLRTEYYQTTLTAPAAFLFGQDIDARSVSFTSSAAYQWAVPNSNWFIEPSAGIIISRAKVDPFNYTGTGTPPGPILPFGDNLSETLRINDIESEIGRVGLRVGTTIGDGQLVWQPFAAVSVWHEFGPNITSTNVTCPNCTVAGAPLGATTLTNTSSTSTFGTYGQYSLGISAALAGTGWLGFARVDYRDGPNLEGLSGTGGFRYQFTPDASAGAVMPLKAPPPVAQPINWTGFYVGGFGGATLGNATWNYGSGEADPHIGGYDFGGVAGYDYQPDRWVFGVAADVEKTSTSGGTACGPLANLASVFAAPIPGPMFQMTCNASADC